MFNLSANTMKNDLSEEQTQAILKALDDAIEHGSWDASNFLRVIGKNLREIRDGFASRLEPSTHEKIRIASNLANHAALRTGQQEIFISLYSSDGATLSSWERILINLPKQMISRPIYANEEDVGAIIKSKENKQNEAYVSIFVNLDDILPVSSDKSPVDKLGKKLLTIKDKSLMLDNINRFVHESGFYKFAHGRLIKNSATD